MWQEAEQQKVAINFGISGFVLFADGFGDFMRSDDISFKSLFSLRKLLLVVLARLVNIFVFVE